MNDKFGEEPTIEESITKRKVLQKKKKNKGKELKMLYAINPKSQVMWNMIALSTKPREKRGVMMATLSQSEDSSDDEDEKEVANICFMAFDDQDAVNSNLI